MGTYYFLLPRLELGHPVVWPRFLLGTLLLLMKVYMPPFYTQFWLSYLVYSLVDLKLIFSYPYPTFQEISDPDPISDPT